MKHWGKTQTGSSCTRRGLIQVGKLKAEIVITGISGELSRQRKYRYEITLNGGRSARSLYTFHDMPSAQAEAEEVSSALLAVIASAPGGKQEGEGSDG